MSEQVNLLRTYNKWRRSEIEGSMDDLGLHPADIGKAIDAVLDDYAALQAEVERLRELSDEAFATIVAALSLAPQDCGAHGVLDDAIKNLQPKWIRSAMEPCDPDTIRALLAERDELAKDAERYRWLRDREIPEWLDLWHQNPDRIDAAIDAELAKVGDA